MLEMGMNDGKEISETVERKFGNSETIDEKPWENTDERDEYLDFFGNQYHPYSLIPYSRMVDGCKVNFYRVVGPDIPEQSFLDFREAEKLVKKKLHELRENQSKTEFLEDLPEDEAIDYSGFIPDYCGGPSRRVVMKTLGISSEEYDRLCVEWIEDHERTQELLEWMEWEKHNSWDHHW